MVETLDLRYFVSAETSTGNTLAHITYVLCLFSYFPTRMKNLLTMAVVTGTMASITSRAARIVATFKYRPSDICSK